MRMPSAPRAVDASIVTTVRLVDFGTASPIITVGDWVRVEVGAGYVQVWQSRARGMPMQAPQAGQNEPAR